MLPNSLNLHKSVRFQTDPALGGGDPPAQPPAKDPPATPPASDTPKTFTQDDVNLIMGKTRKEERDKARKEVEAEFQSKQDSEKANLEKTQLEEQGKFKELSEKAQADKVKAEEKAKAAEDKSRRLELEIELDKSVSRNGLKFVDEQARDDALKILDFSTIGEEISADMDKLVKDFNKKSAYYFGEATEPVETDGSKRGKRPSAEQLTKDKVTELAKRAPAINRRPT